MSGFNFNHSYISLPENLFSRVQPQSMAAPQLILYNASVDAELGLEYIQENNERLADIYSADSRYPLMHIPSHRLMRVINSGILINWGMAERYF